jgi:plasmid stabilization system protein ParE
MNRKLVWTEKASGDIEAIVRYIARRDPGAAARIGPGIYDRAQRSVRTSRRTTRLRSQRADQFSSQQLVTLTRHAIASASAEARRKRTNSPLANAFGVNYHPALGRDF